MAYQFDFAAVLQHSDLLLQGAAFTLGLTAIGTLLGSVSASSGRYCAPGASARSTGYSACTWS